VRFNVEMWAFCGGEQIRTVEVPDERETTELLDNVFHYGQNDIQSQPCPSVSSGDIICLPDGTRHMVMSFGFLEVPKDWTPKKYYMDHGGKPILPPLPIEYDTLDDVIEYWDNFIRRTKIAVAMAHYISTFNEIYSMIKELPQWGQECICKEKKENLFYACGQHGTLEQHCPECGGTVE